MSLRHLEDQNVIITAAGLRLLCSNPMSKLEHCALWEFAASLTSAGSVVSQSEVAERINASPAHVNKAIHKLCTVGLLLRGEKAGVHYHYRLNPAFLHPLN